MKKLMLLIAVSVGILYACSGSKSTGQTTSGDNPESLNGVWELNYLTNTRLSANELYPDKKPFVLFNIKESKVSGSTGCNNFTGMLSSISAGKIRFDESMAMTKMFCPGDGENVFIENLKKVDSYSITDGGKTLHLMQGDVDMFRLEKK